MTSKAKFPLGKIVGTPGAFNALEKAKQPPWELIKRHNSGDWGDLCDEDKRENEYAIMEGLRVFSSYNLSNGEKIWIITEADRSVTTILLPEDY